MNMVHTSTYFYVLHFFSSMSSNFLSKGHLHPQFGIALTQYFSILNEIVYSNKSYQWSLKLFTILAIIYKINIY